MTGLYKLCGWGIAANRMPMILEKCRLVARNWKRKKKKKNQWVYLLAGLVFICGHERSRCVESGRGEWGEVGSGIVCLQPHTIQASGKSGKVVATRALIHTAAHRPALPSFAFFLFTSLSSFSADVNNPALLFFFFFLSPSIWKRFLVLSCLKWIHSVRQVYL